MSFIALGRSEHLSVKSSSDKVAVIPFPISLTGRTNKMRAREEQKEPPSLKPAAVLLDIARARSRGPNGLRTTRNKQAKKTA